LLPEQSLGSQERVAHVHIQGGGGKGTEPPIRPVPLGPLTIKVGLSAGVGSLTLRATGMQYLWSGKYDIIREREILRVIS
jgi:hypothetical protein